jgi:hypothetical protein
MKKSRGYIKFWIIAVLLLLEAGAARSQNSNLGLTVISPWMFIINDATKIETPQVISNAFMLSVYSKTHNCSVYARISSWTVPTGFIPTSSPLALDFNSTTAPSSAYSNLYTQPLTLSTTNQLLFSQYKSSLTRTYFYNINLDALGYDYIPGTYNWEITFTMTQP